MRTLPSTFRDAELVACVLRDYMMEQRCLAENLGVSATSVSLWLSGARHPSLRPREQLTALVAASQEQGVLVGATGYRGARPLFAPDHPWEPIFRPAEAFTLPMMLDWSQRTGGNIYRPDRRGIANASAQVLSEGRVCDILAWVDPVAVLEVGVERLLGPFQAAIWKPVLERSVVAH